MKTFRLSYLSGTIGFTVKNLLVNINPSIAMSKNPEAVIRFELFFSALN